MRKPLREVATDEAGLSYLTIANITPSYSREAGPPEARRAE